MASQENRCAFAHSCLGPKVPRPRHSRRMCRRRQAYCVALRAGRRGRRTRGLADASPLTPHASHARDRPRRHRLQNRPIAAPQPLRLTIPTPLVTVLGNTGNTPTKGQHRGRTARSRAASGRCRSGGEQHARPDLRPWAGGVDGQHRRRGCRGHPIQPRSPTRGNVQVVDAAGFLRRPGSR